ncbi:MAG: O-acetyl-ADP-ribose deacetylase [Pseudomonadota bacterium]
MKFSVTRQDITTLDVDAIVNAANATLLGGGGVDGAIHRAAGPKLLEYCRSLGGCEVGHAKISPGFSLRAQYVIHTVGPIWQGGDASEPTLLANCYRACLQLASQTEVKRLAFPAISTGVYGYPKALACRTAVDEVTAWSAQAPAEVIFSCFDDETESLYLSAMSDVP